MSNPCLDVPPSYAITPSEVTNGEKGTGEKDSTSVLAFRDGCCTNGANGANGV
jgi:primary-amine oxidase